MHNTYYIFVFDLKHAHYYFASDSVFEDFPDFWKLDSDFKEYKFEIIDSIINYLDFVKDH